MVSGGGKEAGRFDSESSGGSRGLVSGYFACGCFVLVLSFSQFLLQIINGKSYLVKFATFFN